MTPPLQRFHLRGWTVIALLTANCFSSIAAMQDPPWQEIAATLQRQQEQIDQQTKRLDRLYQALGPQLEEFEARAAEAQKRRQEDEALDLERICEVRDEKLTAIGCVDPASTRFAVITTEGAVRVFDSKGTATKNLRQSGHEITCAAFSPDGSALLTGTEKGALLLWNFSDGNCRSLSTNVGNKVGRVTWLGKDRIAWGTYVAYWKDGKPLNHDVPAGAVLNLASGLADWTFHGFVRGDFFTLAGAQDGRQLAVLEIPGQPRAAFLLDAKTGEVRHTCYDKAHGSGPLSVAISPDGSLMAIGYAPYDIILWNASTGERLKLLRGHNNWVVSLAFSSDGKRLISGAGDSTARIWDLETGQEIGRLRFEGRSTYVKGVGLSPKGDIAFASIEGLFVAAKPPR